MHLNQLKRFLVVAAAGNLRRAAQQLNVSQPALTQSLQALEITLGEKLFVRGARGVALSDFGRALLPRARLILNECERLNADLQDVRSQHQAQLRVGVGPYFTRHLFPAAAAQTLAQFPDARLQIVDAHTTELAQMLLEGNIDVAFCVHNPRLDAERDLQFEDIYTEKYSVMARSGHSLFARSRSSAADLSRCAWIVLDPQATAGLLVRFFEERRLPPPRWSVSTLSLSAMLGLLASTNLLALVPRDFAQPDVAAGRLRRVVGHALEVQGRAGLLTRRDAILSRATEALMQGLRLVCAEARTRSRRIQPRDIVIANAAQLREYPSDPANRPSK